MKNISLGVTLPSKYSSYLKLQGVRVFASASNWFTIASWDMYDPEVGNDGVMAWQTPPLKTIAFGLDLTF